MSWGTPFQKNFIYIGENTLKVIVYIIGKEFTREYHHLVENNKIVYTFKNATFHYIFANESDFLNDSFYKNLNYLT